MTESIVRVAQPSEEQDVMRLCRSLHEENGIFDIDEDMVRAMLLRAFNRQGGIIGVIGEPGHLEAAIYMLLSHHWYSREPHLEELFNYVVPEFRKTSHAKSLIAFAKRCSEEMNLKLVIGVVSNIRTEAKVRLYQRQLGTPAGAFFVFPGKTAAVGLNSNG